MSRHETRTRAQAQAQTQTGTEVPLWLEELYRKRKRGEITRSELAHLVMRGVGNRLLAEEDRVYDEAQARRNR